MVIKRAVFTVLAALLLGVLLAACQGSQESTELNLLCVPQEVWCEGMKQEFEQEFGITVNYVRMSTGEALARLEGLRRDKQESVDALQLIQEQLGKAQALSEDPLSLMNAHKIWRDIVQDYGHNDFLQRIDLDIDSFFLFNFIRCVT